MQSGDVIDTRRQFLLLALLASSLPLGGCAGPAEGFGSVDASQLGSRRILALGRIRVVALDEDVTPGLLCETTAGDERLLTGSGDVAWLFERTSYPVRIARIQLPRGSLGLGGGPVLVPAHAPSSIVYFGTIHVILSQHWNTRASERPDRIELRLEDEAPGTMAAFVRENPWFAGRSYFHLLRRQDRHAPGAPPAPPRSTGGR